MIKKISSHFNRLRWQTKLVLSCSTAIFLTFFLFSFLEYHIVSKWMMNREEIAINRTMSDITTFYNAKSNKPNRGEIKNSQTFLRKMNDKDQLIRVYDKDGHVLVSDKNGDFPVLEAAPTRKKVTQRVSIEGDEAFVSRAPLKGDDFTGTVEIVRQLNNYRRMMGYLFWVMTIFGVAAIIFSAISGYLLAKQLLKPVRDLAKAMKQIKETGFQERMNGYKQKDELTALTNVFNEMMDEIEKSFLLQKQFVEDASHELRTPVSILEGHLSLLNRWGKKDSAILDESLEASLQEVTRLKKLINDLLHITRAEHPRLINEEKTDISETLHQLVKNLEIVHPDYNLFLEVGQRLPKIPISRQHMEQIMIILLDNAIQYSSNNKEIWITAMLEGEEMIISVVDSGIGIRSEDLAKVFNRFYRVDQARSRENGGTGLGLSIAQRLIKKYNGTISIESQEGVGTTVKMALPCSI
ncbi:signal transduction histidine kinase [Neobacillus bataviensis]|uniref:Signal transduction histidine-protein kinase ArlS n=1 Tax=Neobacillus bataviensis TaxID=220685 RepID=A0A561DRR0_9BACI|nr:HAMP domain-containing histidine kinase [Neobacillus bataviensis]TWE06023.1 signal transduction histidine kinase [Neobacillus bataviensis]